MGLLTLSARPRQSPARLAAAPLSARASRDDAAFTALVSPHIPGLLRLARRVMRDADLAWDVVQESLFCLWQAEIRPPEPRPWLARAVIHRCLHLKRTLRRRSAYEEQAGRALAGERGECPEHSLENHRLAALLRDALATLPADQSEIVILREVHGVNYQTLAERLGVPVGTVRSRLHRARAALRLGLATAVPGGFPAGPRRPAPRGGTACVTEETAASRASRHR